MALAANAPSQTIFYENGLKDLSIGWSKTALRSSEKTAEGLRVADPPSAKGSVRAYERDWDLPPYHGAGPEPGISCIWMMGQSLCDGSESLPVVTADETGWGNLAFQRGVRTWLPKDNSATPDLRPAELFKLVPLRAQANGGLGETVANGMADHWQYGRFGSDKAGAAQATSRFLGLGRSEQGRTQRETLGLCCQSRRSSTALTGRALEWTLLNFAGRWRTGP